MDENRIKSIKAHERALVASEWNDFDPNDYATIGDLKRCVTIRLHGFASALIKTRQAQAGLSDLDQASKEIRDEVEIRQRWLLKRLLTGCGNREWVSEIKESWEKFWKQNRERRQKEQKESLRVLYPNPFYAQLRDIYENFNPEKDFALIQIAEFISSFIGQAVNDQKIVDLIAIMAKAVTSRDQKLFTETGNGICDLIREIKSDNHPEKYSSK